MVVEMRPPLVLAGRPCGHRMVKCMAQRRSKHRRAEHRVGVIYPMLSHSSMMSPDGLKRCYKCGESKPFGAFNRSQHAYDGHQDKCRSCQTAYRAARRDIGNARVAAWRAAHREQVSIRAAAYRATHREQIRATDAAYRDKHKDRLRASKLAYQSAHREQANARCAAYYATHREQYTAFSALRRARQAAAPVVEKIDRTKIWVRDLGKCWLKLPGCWGDRLTESGWHADHAVSLAKGGEHSARNIRVSCPNCNRKKNSRDVTHQRYLL